MTVIELKAKEQAVLNGINGTNRFPCQYSVEELKERLSKSRDAIKKGAYKTQEEMRRKHPAL